MNIIDYKNINKFIENQETHIMGRLVQDTIISGFVCAYYSEYTLTLHGKTIKMRRTPRYVSETGTCFDIFQNGFMYYTELPKIQTNVGLDIIIPIKSHHVTGRGLFNWQEKLWNKIDERVAEDKDNLKELKFNTIAWIKKHINTDAIKKFPDDNPTVYSIDNDRTFMEVFFEESRVITGGKLWFATVIDKTFAQSPVFLNGTKAREIFDHYANEQASKFL